MSKKPFKHLRECFPVGYEPRPWQLPVCDDVEKQILAGAQVIVISAPVAFGKTLLLLAIAKFQSQFDKKTFIGTKDNTLVQQITGQFPKLFALKKKEDYTCRRSEGRNIWTCADYPAFQGGKVCADCPYTAANRRARAVPYQVGNFYTYLAHKLYSNTLVMDEAHSLVGMLRDLSARKLWWSEYRFPPWVKTYSSLLKWAMQELEKRSKGGAERRPSERPSGDKKLQILKEDLLKGKNSYLVERRIDTLRGHEEECLAMLPIDTSAQPPILWPPAKVKLVVLLSATIGHPDIEQLGLAKQKVAWITAASPIPPENRPIVIEEGLDLSHKAGGKDIPALKNYLAEKLAKHRGEKGLIHATYGLAEQLRDLNDPRLIFHNRSDKLSKIREFIARTNDCVLVCSGLYEGLDLKGDLGRWQVITKLPWASLAEPAVNFLAMNDRMRYSWETARLVMQASGRICRGVDDFGVTYVPDKSIASIPSELWLPWFIQGLEAGRLYAR